MSEICSLLEKAREKGLSGPEFVKIMDEFGIKPKDLGITSRYKNMLKRGERAPSKALLEKLLSLLNGTVCGSRNAAVAQPGWSAALVRRRSRVRIPAAAP